MELVMTTSYLRIPGRSAQRQLLRSQGSWTFVDAYQFQRLAISLRKLVRADAPDAGLRGLLDVETGERFVTEEENLFKF
jgi:hypothetical protein